MPIFNHHILMSDAANFSVEQPINPYYSSKIVDKTRAQNEHESVKQALINSGAKITSVPSPVNCQDGVYTANWALVRGDKAVLANLPNVRQAEEDYAEKILLSIGKKVIHIPRGLKFSGQGDALPCGDLLFCGSGYRSDEAAQDFTAKTLGFRRIQLRTIPKLNQKQEAIINRTSGWPDSLFYDLDLALAVIKPPKDGQKGLIAYCPDAFIAESQRILNDNNQVEKILVSYKEATETFATNLVSTGDSVIMSSQAINLKAELAKHGLHIITPLISELSKGGGYIRCITLTLD